jgi:hypothetical protein
LPTGFVKKGDNKKSLSVERYLNYFWTLKNSRHWMKFGFFYSDNLRTVFLFSPIRVLNLGGSFKFFTSHCSAANQ